MGVRVVFRCGIMWGLEGVEIGGEDGSFVGGSEVEGLGEEGPASGWAKGEEGPDDVWSDSGASVVDPDGSWTDLGGLDMVW
jgi:hypothetical protein